MLALSVPLRSAKDEREVEMEGFDGEFPDFCAGSLLDSIDFDDLFVGISDGDVLPDLENLAEFTLSGGDESDANASTLSVEENSSFKHEKVASPETVVMSEDVAVKEADEGVRKSMAHSKNPSGKRKVKVNISSCIVHSIQILKKLLLWRDFIIHEFFRLKSRFLFYLFIYYIILMDV